MTFYVCAQLWASIIRVRSVCVCVCVCLSAWCVCVCVICTGLSTILKFPFWQARRFKVYKKKAFSQ